MIMYLLSIRPWHGSALEQLMQKYVAAKESEVESQATYLAQTASYADFTARSADLNARIESSKLEIERLTAALVDARAKLSAQYAELEVILRDMQPMQSTMEVSR